MQITHTRTEQCFYNHLEMGGYRSWKYINLKKVKGN